MIIYRSAENLKKERALQDVETVKINLEIQRNINLAGSFYRERIEDMALFANDLRESAPEGSYVVLHHRPEIIFSLESEDYRVEIFMSDNCWRFKVNGSVHYELPEGDKFGPTRALKKLWDVVIPKLPEGFIIRGVASSNDRPEEAAIRNIGRKKLGFSDPQANDEVYGIIRNGALTPLTLDDFLSLTKKVPGLLMQKFSTRKINWSDVVG